MTDAAVKAGEPLRVVVAEEIRALLGRRQMSRIELSRRLGKSHSYVWRRLSGATPFDLDDLEQIAVELGVTAADLIPRPGTGASTRERPGLGLTRPGASRVLGRPAPALVGAGRAWVFAA